MTTTPSLPAPLNLWLIDRSGSDAGLGHCRRDRYLSRHAGPHGYGWQRKAQGIPALTGQLVHSPLAQVLTVLRDHDRLPTDAETYAAIVGAQEEYRGVVTARGLALVVDEAELELRTQEQLCLLEGLVWAFVRVALPDFYQQYTVVSVEEEHVSVLGCTCGLGDNVGAAADHDARSCSGIGWMTRADCVTEARVGGSHAYHEFKTTSDASMNWEAQWYHRTQLVAGVLGEEARLGVTIDQVYIHALIKGRNSREWNPDEGKASGPKYQNSPLVYGGCRPANPPLLAEEWTLEWANQYYFDPDLGKRKKRGKDYTRTGLWTFSLWQDTGALSALDFWTGWMGEKLGESYRCIGPIVRKPGRVEEFTRQLVAEEQRWQAALWALYQHEEATGEGWGTAGYDAQLDALIPMSRGDACQNFFGDTCPMLALCDKHDGWQDPKLMGYLERRPHHQPELDQAIGRGLLPPDAGAAEEYEE